jgi:glutamine amidotransferase-like uncharacterized protein
VGYQLSVGFKLRSLIWGTALFLGLAAKAKDSGRLALIYGSKGACRECAQSAAARAREVGLTVKFVKVEDDSSSLFQNAAVWIQPGGLALDAAHTMPEALKKSVVNFVQRGGAYVGFCAGAFLASEKMHIDGEHVDGFGMIPSDTSVFEKIYKDVEVISVPWFGKDRYFLWYWGPVFDAPVQSGKIGDFDVVSSYRDGRALALRGKFGLGKVFVTAVHPESPESWRSDYSLKDPDGLDWDVAREMISWVLP